MCKTTGVVIGTNYSLCSKPKLSINHMLIKLVVEAKPLGVIEKNDHGTNTYREQ